LAVNSVEDLIKLAKQRTLGYGSGGVGAFHHLAAALFSSMVGIKMIHVPYRGSAPALNDLMAGYIQVMFTDYGPASALIASGKLRALAVTTKKPFAMLPEVPPLADAGVPGFDAAAWQGVIAPSQTPPVIVAKLNDGLNAAVAMNDVRARMRDIGMLPVGTGSPEELAQFFQSEIVRWGKVVQDAGIARSE
jgi:tripartite-type tricarboxylate transporter receptor subunit TctC